jgi:hypothetical protein
MPLQTYTTLIGATSPSPVTYTVDYRLREFRTIDDDNMIHWIDFRSPLGDDILCEMLSENLVPEDKMHYLV